MPALSPLGLLVLAAGCTLAGLAGATASPDIQVDMCSNAAAQMSLCRRPPLAALAPSAAEANCCKPFLDLLLSNCFWCVFAVV